VDGKTPQSDGELFRLLVESVKDYGIFMLDPDGRVATWNAGAESMKGYAAHEIIGYHFSRFYEPEAVARGWPDHELEMAKAHGRFEDEGWRVRKDGSRFWASIVITALRAPDGTLRGFAKVTRDLTARLRIEELQRSGRRVNEFLAMLGHELRNPLAPMRTALDIAERAPDDPAVARFSRDVFSRQLKHITRLVDDLLDVGRITSNKIQLKLDVVDLNQIARDAVATLQPLCDASGQTLRVSLPDTPTYLLADATRIAQIAWNLLANANKYTPAGGTITLTVTGDGQHALLDVTDTGIGMGPDLLPLVFEPFVQGERALDRQGGGLGIGLTLARRLAELHGGTLAATSPGKDRGSTFSVRLPMHSPNASRDHESSRSLPRSPLHVLVVDDNPDVLQSMAMLVRLLGHEVQTAADGRQAIAAAQRFAPDVVLLDIGLPGMNGYEVARSLRALPESASALIVACTGYGREDDRLRSSEAGFDRHAVKPLAVDVLTEIFAESAERKRG
jgi:PAS domain S-box-containing protein